MLALLPHKVACAAEEQHGPAWHASEQLSYDDNLYRLSSGFIATPGILGVGRTMADYINTVSLGLGGTWTLGRQSLECALQVEDDRYAHNSSLNHFAGAANLLWGWRATDGLSGRIGATYTRALAAFANTLFYSEDLVNAASYFADARFQVAQRWTLVGGAKDSEISHQNPARRIDNYHEHSGNVGAEYKTASENAVGWDYRYTRARFDQQTVLNGTPFDRDFNENTASVRLNYALTAKTSAQGDIGVLHRNYPSGSVRNVSGDVWHLSLQWQPSAKTQLLLAGWRELRAYLDAQSNAFVANGFKLSPAWAPTSKVAISLQESWEDQRYIGSTASTSVALRRDTVQSATANVIYTPLRSLQVSASYSFERRVSNRGYLDYHDNLASVSLQYSR